MKTIRIITSENLSLKLHFNFTILIYKHINYSVVVVTNFKKLVLHKKSFQQNRA